MDGTVFRPRISIAGVPVHAFLVSFPIACFTGALLTDIAYVQSDGLVQWANFSQWLLAFGELIGVVAALCGLIDLIGNPRAVWPRGVGLHIAGTAVILILGLFNNLVHARDGWTGVVPTGITLSAITVAIVVIDAFIGLRMSHVPARRGAL